MSNNDLPNIPHFPESLQAPEDIERPSDPTERYKAAMSTLKAISLHRAQCGSPEFLGLLDRFFALERRDLDTLSFEEEKVLDWGTRFNFALSSLHDLNDAWMTERFDALTEALYHKGLTLGDEARQSGKAPYKGLQDALTAATEYRHAELDGIDVKYIGMPDRHDKSPFLTGFAQGYTGAKRPSLKTTREVAAACDRGYKLAHATARQIVENGVFDATTKRQLVNSAKAFGLRPSDLMPEIREELRLYDKEQLLQQRAEINSPIP